MEVQRPLLRAAAILAAALVPVLLLQAGRRGSAPWRTGGVIRAVWYSGPRR